MTSCRITSVDAQLCPTLWDCMDCSTSGFPALHYLLELAQIHVHWVGDAIQPSHFLSPSSLPAFNFLSIKVFSNESALHITRPKYWGLFPEHQKDLSFCRPETPSQTPSGSRWLHVAPAFCVGKPMWKVRSPDSTRCTVWLNPSGVGWLASPQNVTQVWTPST